MITCSIENNEFSDLSEVLIYEVLDEMPGHIGWATTSDRVTYPYWKLLTERVVRMLISYVGLDVHKDSITIAIADEGQEKARLLGTVSSNSNILLKRLRKIAFTGDLQCCYEAGSGEYSLFKALSSADIDCRVIAPLSHLRRMANE